MSEQKKIDAERAAFNDYLNEVVETKHYGMKTIKLQRHDEYTVDDEKIAWDAWQARASLPVGVPDGLFLGDALLMWNRRHDIPPIKVGYEYGVADALLQTLTAPAAPTVKAEQVPADRAALVAELREAAGEIARAGHFGWGNSMTAAADALAAPSLPSAGSAELIAEAERCLFVLREIGSMDGDEQAPRPSPERAARCGSFDREPRALLPSPLPGFAPAFYSSARHSSPPADSRSRYHALKSDPSPRPDGCRA